MLEIDAVNNVVQIVFNENTFNSFFGGAAFLN